jgi:hypothetical protein
MRTIPIQEEMAAEGIEVGVIEIAIESLEPKEMLRGVKVPT